MKSVFVAGSRKFSEDVMDVCNLLKNNDIDVNKGRDSTETESDKISQMFGRIDKSDIVFLVANSGYIGRTVLMEIAYAYAKGKEIISSCKPGDVQIQEMVSKILTKEGLVEYCKSK